MKNKILTILISICFLLAVISCDNMFAPTDIAQTAKGEGLFTLNISRTGSARTIMPETTQGSYAVYTLVFTSGERTQTFDRTEVNISQRISLQTGTWNLTVTAYLDTAKTQPAANGSITGIIITAGGSVSKNLLLLGIIEEGATGTFTWNIDYPAEVVTASMTIAPIDEVNGTAAQTLYFTGGEIDTVKDNSATPLELNTGFYRVIFNLNSNETGTGREEYLHVYKNKNSHFEFTFTEGHFITVIVTNGSNTGAGSLRNAIESALDYSTIAVAESVKTIELSAQIIINKNLTIQGNGVTIKRSASWFDKDINSQFIYITSPTVGSDPENEVKISRIHFTGGKSNYGGAVTNWYGDLILESCIFSYNEGMGGGAIYNSQFARGLTINGCTFYGNKGEFARAIGNVYNGDDANAYFNMAGNIFYANEETNFFVPAVSNVGATIPITSVGYNVLDFAEDATGIINLGGWTAHSTDVGADENAVVAPKSFRMISGSPAAHIITDLPAGYPKTDFFGAPIVNGASAGAIQSIASGFVLETSVNNKAHGTLSVTTNDNDDGLYTGNVSLTAAPASGRTFLHWVENGVKVDGNASRTYAINKHTKLQAVFALCVNDFTDASTAGTFRFALTNADKDDIILFDGVEAGVTTITITSALPAIAKDITIEGNGVVLTRSAFTAGLASQLLTVNAGTESVKISRMHFKNGSAFQGGAIKNSGNLSLESCIFSGNSNTSTTTTNGGGAIYNAGELVVKGCTFLKNTSVTTGGAILQVSPGRLTLIGNIFNGNTATTNNPITAGGTYNTNDIGFNVVDSTQGTWTLRDTDKVSSFPVLLETADYKLIPSSEAANVITTLPSNYPNKDFYGSAITNGAAAGAVQSAVVSSGKYLGFSANDSARGSVTTTATPDQYGLYSGSVTLTAAKTGAGAYEFVGWAINGEMDTTKPLSITINMDKHYTAEAVFGYFVTNFADSGVGTLREALTNGASATNDYIWFKDVVPGVSKIELSTALPTINNKNLTIEGNGITIERAASAGRFRILTIGGTAGTRTVKLSRVHIKNGDVVDSTNQGGGIYSNQNLILESCIFTGNKATDTYNNSKSGAVYVTDGNLTIYGCTFYGNGYYNNPIYAYNASINKTFTFVGNVLNGNDSDGISYSGYSLSLGGLTRPNVSMGTGTNTEFRYSPALAISPVNLKPIAGGIATNVLTTIPAAYPKQDFYGAPITAGAAAGAIQATTSGYAFSLTQTTGGTVNITSQGNYDESTGLYTGTIGLTAVPSSPLEVLYWLVNGEKVQGGAAFSVNMNSSKAVSAVFGIVVTNAADTGEKTLRWALANIADSCIIDIRVPEIKLDSQIAHTNVYAKVQGNSVIISPSSNWTGEVPLFSLTGTGYGSDISFYRIHFKDFKYGIAAATDYRGNFSFYSCIFSGNKGRLFTGSQQSSGSGSIGTSLGLSGCTFYNNDADTSDSFTSVPSIGATGNLFYGNKGPAGFKLVTTNGWSPYLSAYANVSDMPIGTGAGQTGWTVGTIGVGYNNTTLSDLGITGVPFNTTTFKPTSSALKMVGMSPPETDFNGDPRGTAPWTAGAVNY